MTILVSCLLPFVFLFFFNLLLIIRPFLICRYLIANYYEYLKDLSKEWENKICLWEICKLDMNGLLCYVFDEADGLLSFVGPITCPGPRGPLLERFL